MAIDYNLEQPKQITNIEDDPNQAQEDINEAIRVLMRNIEEIKNRAKEE